LCVRPDRAERQGLARAPIEERKLILAKLLSHPHDAIANEHHTGDAALNLPGLPAKGDIVDWAGNGGTVEQLHALLETAEPWTPPANETRAEAFDAGE
jgi:hypothetical protein